MNRLILTTIVATAVAVLGQISTAATVVSYTHNSGNGGHLGTVSGGDLYKPPVSGTGTGAIGSNVSDNNTWGTGSTSTATGPDIGSTWRMAALLKVGAILSADGSDAFTTPGDLNQPLALTLTLGGQTAGTNSAGYAPQAYLWGIDASASGTTGWWGTAGTATQAVSNATPLTPGQWNAGAGTWTFDLSTGGLATSDTGDIFGIAVVGNENAVANESLSWARNSSSLTVAPAAGATVLVDFSAAESTPGGLQGGNYWNTVGDNNANSLLGSSTGLDSGWDVTVTDGGTYTGFGGTAINGNGDAAPFDQSFAIIDGIFSNHAQAAGTATITFTNLTPDTDYDFSTYSDRAGGWADGVISTTVGTGPASVAILKDAVTDFTMTSDASGTIAFTFVEGPGESSNVGDNAVLNALSMTEVPEPSTLALAAMGLAGLVRRRRA